jgi:lysophospholipase L1-like esterase
VNKTSFAEKFKSKAKDTIVLVGDSLARGVGQKLEQQSHMVTTKSRGGARIEQVTEQIGLLQDNVDRHLLVLVGTNNVENDSSEAIRLKYRSLLEASKKVKNRKVSVIGIPRRYDLSGYQNSRRIGANLELERMCVERDIGFIAYEPYRSRIAKDELHFNHVGQDELARKIFEHCKSFLV